MRLGVGIHRAARGDPFASQVVRYGIVVACGYVLAISFYSGELDIGVPAYPALGIAFVVNGLFNFALLRVWAFPASGRSLGSDLRRFCVVAAVSSAVNYASFAVLYSAIGLHASTAQRLAIVIAAPVTFLANRLWSFRAHAARASARQLSSAEDAGGGAANHMPDLGHERDVYDADDRHGLKASPPRLATIDRVRPRR
jgi:putative flippase GtrA